MLTVQKNMINVTESSTLFTAFSENVQKNISANQIPDNHRDKVPEPEKMPDETPPQTLIDELQNAEIQNKSNLS